VAKITDERIAAAIQPFLEPGEQIQTDAYGFHQMSLWIMIPLILVALLPAFIAQMLLTKYYMVALTNRRILIFHCDNKLKVKEIIEYRPGAMPPVNVSSGMIFAVLKIMDPRGGMRIKFHRATLANNREKAAIIGNAMAVKATA
jgi:hypothetical protein